MNCSPHQIVCLENEPEMAAVSSRVKAKKAELAACKTLASKPHPDGVVPKKGGRASPCDSALAS